MSGLDVHGGPERTEVPLHWSPSLASRDVVRYSVREAMEERSPDGIIRITQEDIRVELARLMRLQVYKPLRKQFRKRQRIIDKEMQKCHVNNHDEAHQMRVAALSAALARAFGVEPKFIHAASLAASFHDIGYEPQKGRERAHVQKQDFDDHAARGAEIFDAVFDDPQFRWYFDKWSTDMKRVACDAILYHNGAAREIFRRHQTNVHPAAQCVRVADKWDNVKDRVREKDLCPGRLERDCSRDHRIVPAHIREISEVVIGRAGRLVQTIYQVDRNKLREDIRISSSRRLSKQFHATYGDKMRDCRDVFDAVMPKEASASPLSFEVQFREEDGVIDPDATLEYRMSK